MGFRVFDETRVPSVTLNHILDGSNIIFFFFLVYTKKRLLRGVHQYSIIGITLTFTPRPIKYI